MLETFHFVQCSLYVSKTLTQLYLIIYIRVLMNLSQVKILYSYLHGGKLVT